MVSVIEVEQLHIFSKEKEPGLRGSIRSVFVLQSKLKQLRKSLCRRLGITGLYWSQWCW